MRKLKMIVQGFILFFAGLMLAACATGASTQTTEENSIASAMTTLITLQKAAMDYIALPQCGTSGATSMCSTPEMVANLKKASANATTVLMNAQKAAQANQPVDMVAVDAAITALSGYVSSVTPSTSTTGGN